MRSVIAIAVLAIASPSFADSFLCIADKAAILEFNSKTRDIEPLSGDVPGARFIISKNESGDYEAGWFGMDFRVWNECQNFIGKNRPRKLYCKSNYNGRVSAEHSFALESDNVFIAKDVNPDDPEKIRHRIFSGKCSKI